MTDKKEEETLEEINRISAVDHVSNRRISEFGTPEATQKTIHTQIGVYLHSRNAGKESRAKQQLQLLNEMVGSFNTKFNENSSFKETLQFLHKRCVW